MNPDTDIRYLKGVGDARAKLLKKLGITTAYDLLRHFPRDYEDRTVTKNVAELERGDAVCVRAMLVGDARLSQSASGLSLVRARAADGTGVLELFFFNQPYVRNRLRAGERYIFYGRVEREGNLSPRIVNPVFEPESERGARTGRLVPIYRLTAGLSQYHVSGAVKSALAALSGKLPDVSPRGIREKYKLAETGFAYENIHFPKDSGSLAIARRRIMFDELFTFAVAAKRRRNRLESAGGRALDASALDEFYAALPFAPTAAQARAIDDAARDCASGAVMSRLVQGDVGSGKTMVAMAMCFLAAKNGTQTAFMAPTELLAEQHFRTCAEILEPLGVNVALITGSMTKKQRANALSALAAGDADVAVGTHALFSGDVEYRDLALVVVDEQHRFGVAQRAGLAAKGQHPPHILVMSATPIPRTLALILYGDLNVSVIDELPPGRRPVQTYAVDEKKRERIYNFARKLVNEGRQAYFICPAIEEGEVPSGLTTAKDYAKRLAESVFPDLRVGLVHGAMKPRGKDAAMAAFASGETDILVATTVVEVGVDVRNAALIVIENADRYGLSQLHQLRGRVGRGEHESYCVMFEGGDQSHGGEKSRERLEALCATNDGFEIAEQDLRQRGPGDFFGSRQHGLPVSRFADALTESGAALEAAEAADDVLRRDPELELDEHRGLWEMTERVFAETDGTFN